MRSPISLVPASLAIVCLLALTGCGVETSGGGARPATVQQIGNRQELGDVVSLLDQGDEKAARRKLSVMVKRDPTDVRSKALLDSLSADPVATLGERAFDYRVDPGDTMQSLAQRFLGDRLKFYLLARYNRIAIPAQLKIAQMIRIPGEAPAPKPAAPRPHLEAPPPPTQSKAQPPAGVPSTAKRVTNPQRATQLRSAGLTALNKGQIGQSVALLTQALAADPGNVLIQRDLGRARRIQATVKTKL